MVCLGLQAVATYCTVAQCYDAAVLMVWVGLRQLVEDVPVDSLVWGVWNGLVVG